jgi:3-methyladenine DNA glycosylase AlkD
MKVKEKRGRAGSKSMKVQAEDAVASLRRLASKRIHDGMARYGLPAEKAFGVSVGNIRKVAKRIGRDHELAAALWDLDWYEARMLAVFVDDPALVTPAQVNGWARDFDNWGICDTACFHLFDRTPFAFEMVSKLSDRRREFEKRTAFALLASLALHDKKAADTLFLERLDLIERAADDDRNFVKKGVSWALRGIGRRNLALNAATVALARRLSESANAAARWVGKDALRELVSPAVVRRLTAKRAVAAKS